MNMCGLFLVILNLNLNRIFPHFFRLKCVLM
uniref:Uncharacterized protein n=1 Tax=Lepeophtheirus salmonis TaxID=72036 RepID=A0A0K2UB76_LEPSM